MFVIDAAMFKAMIRSGAMDLQRHCEEVNSLNVFPVPDGDTGVNMLATMHGGVDSFSEVKEDSLGACAKALSRGMLYAARGNSGVILSQFFAGLAEGLVPYAEVNVLQFATAFESGVKRAYEVVAKPVEGTILTVMREGGEKSLESVHSASSFEEYFKSLLSHMKDTLNRTPELMPVLKEAGVIDSGGAGLLYIIEGMAQALGGRLIEEVSLDLGVSHGKTVLESAQAFDENSVLDYGYCTEFILQLTNAKGGIEKFSLDEAIRFYSSIGDSLVAFRDGSTVKVHVHTKTPDKAIAYALQFGEFVRFKMDNMTLQHNQTLVQKSRSIATMAIPQEAKKHLASVAVVPNTEVAEIFKTYGVDVTMNVGAFLNPGAEDFVEAFQKAKAEEIILFPNNKNEIMVAEMAASMFEGAKIHVVPTDNVAQGIACASVLDIVDLSLEENLARANATLEKDHTLSVYQAVKDSKYKGINIPKGSYLWHEPSGAPHIALSLLDSVKDFVAHLGLEEASLFTIAYSHKVSQQDREAIEEYVSATFDFVDIQVLDAGECLFDFCAILE
ncbi:MAG: DAK2 domain-containing protein [Bacilli bacterium]|nr:DAK2 domain-containing protein [Bacilli bacterium]